RLRIRNHRRHRPSLLHRRSTCSQPPPLLDILLRTLINPPFTRRRAKGTNHSSYPISVHPRFKAKHEFIPLCLIRFGDVDTHGSESFEETMGSFFQCPFSTDEFRGVAPGIFLVVFFCRGGGTLIFERGDNCEGCICFLVCR